MRIAICPGHHKAAKGAVNALYNLNEHDEAVKVVNALEAILRDQEHDVTVITGRLSEKIAQINKGHFDLALDIHFNAGGGHGCEVVHFPGSLRRREQAADMSHAIAIYMNVHNRGAKEGWYMGGSNPGTKPDAFVQQTNCPAFIIEPCFIDNNNEAAYWLEAGRHGQIAEAIAYGISELEM